MKITKFGHCCLFIEEGEVRVLIDPGFFSEIPASLRNIAVVLITHEHPDHINIDSLETILHNNPQARVLTNSSVGKLLKKENIVYALLEQGQSTAEKNVTIEGVGNEHGKFHSTIPPIQNTGYLIAGKFFYPGDSFAIPPKQVEILALPVAGLWMKLEEALDYGLKIKPRVSIPVHEGMLKTPGFAHTLPPTVFERQGIQFSVLENGKQQEF